VNARMGLNRIRSTDLYDKYKTYCNKNNKTASSNISFYKMLDNININSKHGGAHKYYYTYGFDELDSIFDTHKFITSEVSELELLRAENAKLKQEIKNINRIFANFIY
jgi:hypothetical protein